ncbi:MAG: parallel beta-helix domain-containing protein [Chryseosolibacter sp.]
MKAFVITALLCGAMLRVSAQQEFQKKFQRQFIEAANESVILLPEGTFNLQGSLWLDDKKDVIIRGAGMDRTILNFGSQLSGAEGLKITNAARITIQDLTVQNTIGDGIKAQMVEGITLMNVKAEWTDGADKKNGGYGLYPVQCTNVLIDGCTARGASDAGIYVGQSRFIIVRNSKAYENVAGIEIENSLYADVYGNEVYNNTGGILVFDLPDLIQKKGGYVRVFRNIIRDNNHNNFAPRGNIVGKVPPGTGLMILATNHLEAFDNKITNNITAGTAIISYYITENPINDAAYDPFPANIYIHDNEYNRPRVRATGKGRMGKMYRFKLRFGKDVPHIIYDGIEDEKKVERNICIRNNEGQSFANIDADGGFKKITRDASLHDCMRQPLDEVVFSTKAE